MEKVILCNRRLLSLQIHLCFIASFTERHSRLLTRKMSDWNLQFVSLIPCHCSLLVPLRWVTGLTVFPAPSHKRNWSCLASPVAKEVRTEETEIPWATSAVSQWIFQTLLVSDSWSVPFPAGNSMLFLGCPFGGPKPAGGLGGRLVERMWKQQCCVLDEFCF